MNKPGVRGWPLGKRLRLALFTTLAAVLVVLLTIQVSMNIQSAARAYVASEGLWSKAEKQAVYSLRRYAQNRDTDDYAAFQRFMKVPLGDYEARTELDKPRFNTDKVTKAFLQGRNNAADIPGMISLYRDFGELSYLERAVEIWKRSDSKLMELQAVAAQLHANIQNAGSEPKIAANLATIDRIDSELTLLEDQFSFTIGEASRWLQSVLFAVNALILLLAASIAIGSYYLVSRRILRDIDLLHMMADRIVGGDYNQKVTLQSRDELGSLEKALNSMTESVAASRRDLEASLARSLQDKKQLEDTKKAILNILEDLSRERAISESARLRDEALLSSIGEGLIVIDGKGNISNVNPQGLAILGYKEEELRGKWFPGTLKALNADGKPIDPLDRPVLRALSTGQVITEVIYYLRKDGSSFPAVLTISPVVEDGKPVGAIEVFRDITKERQLEEAKEEFVSLASHQLRTPATGVKAFVSMMLDGYAGKLTSKQQAFMKKVYDTNERQLQIVNDMLNVARIDAGRIRPDFAPTDVSMLIQDILDEQALTIKERQQQVDVSLPKTPVKAVLDPKLVRMVVENLVSNASKYTPDQGRIKVALSAGRDRLRVAVSDTGVGIAKDDLPKLFKRFSRIDNKLSTARGGTGLGLYLAQNIVLLHGGRMTVDSELGKGSTFTVELPFKPPASRADKAEDKPKAAGQGE